MTRGCTWIWAWLLALALPAQGFAAATMVFCGTAHHGAAASALGSASGAYADHRLAPPGHDQSPPHAAHGGTLASDIDLHCGGHADTDAPDLAKTSAHKCSACASCCSALALLGSMSLPVCPQFADTVSEAVAPMVAPFTLDGPERPPRPPLA